MDQKTFSQQINDIVIERDEEIKLLNYLHNQQTITQSEFVLLNSKAHQIFSEKKEKIMNNLQQPIIQERMTLRGDIGTFDNHKLTPGIKFLVDPITTYQSDEVLEVIRKVNKGIQEKNETQTSYYQKMRILNNQECENLRNHVDQNWDLKNSDFKLKLQIEELEMIIGQNTTQKLIYYMDGDFNQILIRRCLAVDEGLCINFHVDFSLKTMQIALNGEDEYIGGRLVFATNDGVLRCPIRKTGSMTIHNNKIVHGVTKHIKGIRYGLFLLKQQDVC